MQFEKLQLDMHFNTKTAAMRGKFEISCSKLFSTKLYILKHSVHYLKHENVVSQLIGHVTHLIQLYVNY